MPDDSSKPHLGVAYVLDRDHETSVASEDVAAGPRSGRSAGELAPPGELPTLVERTVTAGCPGHQVAEALTEQTLDVVGVDVWMADGDLEALARRHHLADRGEHLGVLVLARMAKLLGEVALADQDAADSRDVLQDVRQILDAGSVFDHQDREDLARRVERPDVGALVVLLLREAPVARRRSRPVAADARRLVERGGLEAGVAARRDRVVGLVDRCDVGEYHPVRANVENLLHEEAVLLLAVGGDSDDRRGRRCDGP